MTTAIGFSQDAMTVIGFAGTALAFAGSREEAVERWLRALRVHGDAGCTLRAAGVDEASDARVAPSYEIGWTDAECAEDTLACVIACAEEFAAQRGAPAIGTVELLFAVMRVYGSTFDEALARRGTDRAELIERTERAPDLPPA
ncbi:MAG: hypothetical protein M3Z33_07945 [Actinomycetota bacterium]|nr:hypothetical protein [Actinomycetota bacterium]